MPLSPKHLNENEELILDIHPHWWYFAQTGGLAVVAAVVWYVGARVSDGITSAVSALLFGAFFLTAIRVGWAYLQWRYTNFAITDARVIYQEGLVAKKGIEIPLDRVNNVNFNQTILERIFAVGDLLIESGGEDGQQQFSDIRRPQEVKKILLNQVRLHSDARSGHGRTPQNDVATQLEKLEGLLQRGNLTREEFEREKRRLLGN